MLRKLIIWGSLILLFFACRKGVTIELESDFPYLPCNPSIWRLNEFPSNAIDIEFLEDRAGIRLIALNSSFFALTAINAYEYLEGTRRDIPEELRPAANFRFEDDFKAFVHLSEVNIKRNHQFLVACQIATTNNINLIQPVTKRLSNGDLVGYDDAFIRLRKDGQGMYVALGFNKEYEKHYLVDDFESIRFSIERIGDKITLLVELFDDKDQKLNEFTQVKKGYIEVFRFYFGNPGTIDFSGNQPGPSSYIIKSGGFNQWIDDFNCPKFVRFP